jgi:hypothetical protein
MIWSCCGPRRRSSVISLRGAAGARFWFSTQFFDLLLSPG